MYAAETVQKKIQVYDIIGYVFYGISNSSYCSAHWIFSMKYWTVSYKLSQGKMIRLVNFFYYFVLVLNIGISVFVSVEGGMDLNKF